MEGKKKGRNAKTYANLASKDRCLLQFAVNISEVFKSSKCDSATESLRKEKKR